MKNKTSIFENESNILTTGNIITEDKRYTNYIESLNRDQKDLLSAISIPSMIARYWKSMNLISPILPSSSGKATLSYPLSLP